MTDAVSMERDYWDGRYAAGGTSGAGSVGRLRAWKWQTVERYAGKVQDVVDAPCGDLSFWADRDSERYTGIDISQVVIDANKLARPEWNFICAPLSKRQDGLRADTVFCFDALFHIMDPDEVERALECFRHYAHEWIFIFTWTRNPLWRLGWRAVRSAYRKESRELLWRLVRGGFRTDGKYQTYHPMESHVEGMVENGFDLVAVDHPPFPSVGGMFVFRKRRRSE